LAMDLSSGFCGLPLLVTYVNQSKIVVVGPEGRMNLDRPIVIEDLGTEGRAPVNRITEGSTSKALIYPDASGARFQHEV